MDKAFSAENHLRALISFFDEEKRCCVSVKMLFCLQKAAPIYSVVKTEKGVRLLGFILTFLEVGMGDFKQSRSFHAKL